jgi:hypothetical protein
MLQRIVSCSVVSCGLLGCYPRVEARPVAALDKPMQTAYVIESGSLTASAEKAQALCPFGYEILASGDHTRPEPARTSLALLQLAAGDFDEADESLHRGRVERHDLVVRCNLPPSMQAEGWPMVARSP